MINATIATAAAPINAEVMGAANTLPTNVFRMKTDVAAKTSTGGSSLPAGVNKALVAAQALASSYGKLRVEVLDRSDRALWNLLQEVYAYADSVENSVLKKETRSELIRQIRQRGGAGVSPNGSIAAIAVRYIFADQSRQTCSNYGIAMDKARALGVTTDTFAAFLEQYGGISKVVEHVFDHEAEDVAAAADVAKLQHEERTTRVQLVGRLYTAMIPASALSFDFAGEVTSWVPKKPEKKTKSADKEEKADPKYEQGQFVHFVTVRDPDTGKYHVIQGNIFDRAYEDQILGTLADRIGATTDQLAQAVTGLERQIGFDVE